LKHIDHHTTQVMESANYFKYIKKECKDLHKE